MSSRKRSTGSVFLKRVKDAVKHYDMLRPGDKVLVAVSGGPDSVALLKALFDMRGSLGIDIVAANLDHGIRGKESRRDSELVERFAKKLRIKLEYKKIKLRSRAKGKRSLEEIAREKRYAFLKKAALKNGCSAIATGHTLDDQAETVLMRVITGAALEGLAGIPPVRSEDDIRFIRPLIRTTKKDILSFVKRNGIEYAQDRTNKDIRIKRNRIRIEVLPFLEKLNPRIRRSLANLSDVVRDDLLAMKSGEGSKLRRHPGQKKGLVELMITDLMLQPRALRKAIFKEAVKMTGGNIKKLTHRHWMEMDLLLRTGEKGKSLDLPGNIRATKSADRIEFNKK